VRNQPQVKDAAQQAVQVVFEAVMVRLFTRRARISRRQAAIPAGIRVYAIGDIHGRLDLLIDLHQRIAEDSRGDALANQVIYLGDYIDRGPSSRKVLETLMEGGPAGMAATHLQGNHEAMLLQFLQDSSVGPEWIVYGGLATLLSYGVSPKSLGNSEENMLSIQRDLSERLPVTHRKFLENLPRESAIGDYFFVHAGVRPGISLDQQKASDLIWIREEFLESEEFHGKIIVHGHSYKTEPEVRPNRIGIDTGAYATGRLTCLVLEGASRRFL
jgi:serine/threonine protein phosphatase 1